MWGIAQLPSVSDVKLMPTCREKNTREASDLKLFVGIDYWKLLSSELQGSL